MSRPVSFRQVDVKRAVKGATGGGMAIGRVEIDPTGKIVLVAASQAEAPQSDLEIWLKSQDAH